MYDATFALPPGSPGRGDHLASPVHHVQSRLHNLAAFRLALPPDAPRGGPRCPAGHPRGAQFRMVRGALQHLADGALTPPLRVRTPESGGRADPMRSPTADLPP